MRKNLLDANGYIESVIRHALGGNVYRAYKTDNEKMADEIIARLRGDEDEPEMTKEEWKRGKL